MSSIASVSSAASLYQAGQTRSQNGFGQVLQSLNALGTALQSGDASSAQSALSTQRSTFMTKRMATIDRGTNTHTDSVSRLGD